MVIMNRDRSLNNLSTEIAISNKEFAVIRDLIFTKSGISLGDNKKELVRARLNKRLRSLGICSFRDYYKIVIDDKSNGELLKLLDSISTNITSFYRENNQFDFLKKVALHELEAKTGFGEGSEVRAWSAGCSSGEEPYSLAITLLDHFEGYEDLDIKILATDISPAILDTASKGVYAKESVKSVPKFILLKHFNKHTTDNGIHYQVKDGPRGLVHFKLLNLMSGTFPFNRKFDLILCRNVMIYFDKQTQETLVKKFYDNLAPGGYFLIGHSESLSNIGHSFKYVCPTIFRKPE